MGVDVQNLTVRYNDVTAIDNLSFRLDGGKIYGLLGRNGAGKTTLLSVLSAYQRPSSGSVLVDGAEPFENPRLMPRVCFIQDRTDKYDAENVRAMLSLGEFRPNWDGDYAATLLDRFKLPLKRRVGKLSRGMKSALGCVIGLASRAPVTIFDESYLGMDAPTRHAFYDEILSDYMEHPRTIILSTHLIDEVSPLFEEVVIIDQGRLIAHDETEALKARGTAVVGPAEAVDTVTADMNVLSEQRLGQTKSATVYNPDDDFGQRVRAAGLDMGPVSLQDLFAHLTGDGVSLR